MEQTLRVSPVYRHEARRSYPGADSVSNVCTCAALNRKNKVGVTHSDSPYFFAPARRLSPHSRGLVPAQQGNSRGTSRPALCGVAGLVPSPSSALRGARCEPGMARFTDPRQIVPCGRAWSRRATAPIPRPYCRSGVLVCASQGSRW